MNEKILEAKARQLTGEINARKIRESGGDGWNAKQRGKATAFILAMIYAVKENGRIAATIDQLESTARMSGAHSIAIYIVGELQKRGFIVFKESANGADRFLYKGFSHDGGMFLTERFTRFLCPPPARIRRD